jgi:hypothetical protein
MHKTKDGHFIKFWPELVMSDFVERSIVPPWRLLAHQAAASRTIIKKNIESGELPPDFISYGQHHRRYGTVPDYMSVDDFNIRNINCFQLLPAVIAEREKYALIGARAVGHSLGVVYGSPMEKKVVDDIREQLRHEFAHRMYHQTMWDDSGRRVYVLDEATYTLLAETPLPNLPASILSAPQHSFYLVFPPNSPSKFGIWNVLENREDVQSMEGVMVSIDNIDPDSSKPREIAFLNVGNGAEIGDRNIAYISIALGPDAMLSELRFQDAAENNVLVKLNTNIDVLANWSRNRTYADAVNSGSYDLGVITPRIIFGFLLYLASEHPDIEPIPPAPRRAFKEIKSPKQREAAQKNEAERLKNATRLPILYVGAHLRDEVEHELSGVLQQAKSQEERQWILDHPVWVRGHWKQQPYGEGRILRRLIWIRPYRKGPDMADSMKIKIAKVQRAQHAATKPQIEVTPLFGEHRMSSK